MPENVVPLTLALACGAVFSLALAGLGLFLVLFNLRSRKKAAASQGWPSTIGQITAAGLKESVSRDEDDRTSVAYYPAVEYGYQVGDRAYSGHRIGFGSLRAHGSQAKAAAGLTAYPVGGSVTVYYNPDEPSEAVLERQAGGFGCGMAIGVACLVLGLMITCPIGVRLVMNLLSAGG